MRIVRPLVIGAEKVLPDTYPMRAKIIAGLVISALLALSIPTSLAASTPKVGAICKKVNQKVAVAGVQLKCVKSGKRTIWKVASPTPIASPTPRPTASPTPTPIATPTPTPSEEAQNFQGAALPVDQCKLKQTWSSYFGTGFGFPRSTFRLKNTGTVNGLFLYVEFNDVKGDDDPVIDGESYIPKFVEYYNSVSYGKLKFSYDIYPKYLPIAKNSNSYGMNVWGRGDAYQYWKDGLQAAAGKVDFSKYDFVVVMPPRGIKEIIYGPSMPLPPQDATGATAQKNIYNGLMGGADQRTKATRWIWLAHEIGHDLGMEHQFSYDGEAVWDLMNNVYNFTAPELFGWHRFFQGWFEDSAVTCLDSGKLTTDPISLRIRPLSSSGQGTQLVLIRESEKSAIALEYRTLTAFDTLDGDASLEGVIAYRVDVSKQSNQNAISMITTANPKRNLVGNVAGSLNSGDAVESAGVKIVIAGKSSEGYLVKISR